MARISVYVTEELKARMEQVDGVNWSPIACGAFEEKIDQLNRRNTMSAEIADVVERVRATKKEYEQRGFTAGQQWARTTADYKQLSRLGEALDLIDELQRSVTNDDSGWSNDVAFSILGIEVDSADRIDAEIFWERADVSEGDRQDNSYLVQFIEGAMDVWQEVEPHL